MMMSRRCPSPAGRGRGRGRRRALRRQVTTTPAGWQGCQGGVASRLRPAVLEPGGSDVPQRAAMRRAGVGTVDSRPGPGQGRGQGVRTSRGWGQRARGGAVAWAPAGGDGGSWSDMMPMQNSLRRGISRHEGGPGAGTGHTGGTCRTFAMATTATASRDVVLPGCPHVGGFVQGPRCGGRQTIDTFFVIDGFGFVTPLSSTTRCKCIYGGQCVRRAVCRATPQAVNGLRLWLRGLLVWLARCMR